MEKEKIRKNLKFSTEKKEQKNAAMFLSKIEREQTAFVSYLTNQFLSAHGVTEVNNLTKEDAMMLFYNLKDDYESGRITSLKVTDVDSLVTQENMKSYVEECVKRILAETALDKAGIQIAVEGCSKKEEITIVTDDSPSRTMEETMKHEEDLDEDEDEAVEINQDLLNGLGCFFGS